MKEINELELLEEALWDYEEKNLGLCYDPELPKEYQYGLCYYFYKVHGINFQSDNHFKKHLPVLYSFMPAGQAGTYWFPQGELDERINVLKAAIKEIKDNDAS